MVGDGLYPSIWRRSTALREGSTGKTSFGKSGGEFAPGDESRSLYHATVMDAVSSCALGLEKYWVPRKLCIQKRGRRRERLCLEKSFIEGGGVRQIFKIRRPSSSYEYLSDITRALPSIGIYLFTSLCFAFYVLGRKLLHNLSWIHYFDLFFAYPQYAPLAATDYPQSLLCASPNPTHHTSAP